MPQPPTITIEQIANFVGQEIQLQGWLRHRRSKGKLHFLQMRDGTGEIQAIVSKADVGDEQFESSAQLTQESSLVLSGIPRTDARAPSGFELDVKTIEKSSHCRTVSHSTEGAWYWIFNGTSSSLAPFATPTCYFAYSP